MADFTLSIVLEIINSFFVNKLESAITSNNWKTLFVDSGEAVIKLSEKENAFVEDLRLVFSKDNMKKLARKTENSSGIDFPTVLHDELAELLHKYEVDEIQAESYIHHFIDAILQYIEENDPNKRLSIYLSEWREKEAVQLKKIQLEISEVKKLLQNSNRIDDSVLNIQGINALLKQQSNFNLDLSFFELDDDFFKEKLQMDISLNKTLIYIEGKSKEETLYRILNEINQQYPDKNIFIYNEEEGCNKKDKRILRRRTRNNLIDSLKKIGVPTDTAYQWIDHTHGIYSALKTRIMNCPPAPKKPIWANEIRDEVLAALLLGKWTEAEGDQIEFKTLTGKKYSNCMKTIKQYEHIEQPLIINTEIHSNRIIQIACIEDAWVTLSPYIDEDLKKRFFETFISVMKRPDPAQPSLSEEFKALKEGKRNSSLSGTLKKGMLRTLILFSCLSENKQDEWLVKAAVRQILDSITDLSGWQYISNYITDLCEAAPDIVLERLENELNDSTGMLELFPNAGYYNILCAIEQLIQQEKHVIQATNWLWKMDSKNFDYSNSNSPKDILQIVFCAWINLTPLTCDRKIEMAKQAITLYPNAWDIICSRLPKNGNSVISCLCSTQFRELVNEKPISQKEIYNTYISYLNLCIDNAGHNALRFCNLLKELTYFDKKIQEEKLDHFDIILNEFNDQEKYTIKFKLRTIIYNHRRFSGSNWAISNELITLYETAYNKITISDEAYDYLYLFCPEYNFPLLHPIPYSTEENTNNAYDLEEKQIDAEIKSKTEEYRDLSLSISHLIEIASKTKECERLGYVLAHYFDNNTYNEETYECLLKSTLPLSHQIDCYVRTVVGNDLSTLQKILDKTKELTSNPHIIAIVISNQLVDTVEQCLIFKESEETKKEFWSNNLLFSISANINPAVIKAALEECLVHGTVKVYIEFLFLCIKSLTPEEIYDYFIKVGSFQNGNTDTLSGWYIEQLLNLLHEHFINDQEKAYQIAKTEWFFGNIINWEQMKCMQQYIKTDPHIYAYMINVLYRKDHEGKDNIHNNKYSSSMYGRFYNIHFCPAEKNGIVLYDELKKWVNDYIEILKAQDQYSLWDTTIGDLLPYSPIDEDGYMPCKAVRQLIEEYHTKKMHTAYYITELNKRGVYTASGGKAEKQLAQKYKDNANMIRTSYPWTAQIYDDLSENYEDMSIQERKNAEDSL